MEKELRHIKINAVLSVVYFVALIIVAALDTDTTQAKNGEKAETDKVIKYELPESTKKGIPEQVVEHVGYTVSYNSDWRIPNWVAYELTAEEVQGVEPRGNDFVPDPDIIGSPSTDDYKNSGYDRGHMAPAADMKWSKQAMTESFYTSNICPQNQNLNKGDWKDLEEHVRNMATKYDHIYIACGPIVSAKPKTIGQYSCIDRIAVPDAFFKAILRQKDESWSALGFMMPNQAGHKELSSYAMSIEELEMIIDMDLFYNLPNDIEEHVERTFNLTDWDL